MTIDEGLDPMREHGALPLEAKEAV